MKTIHVIFMLLGVQHITAQVPFISNGYTLQDSLAKNLPEQLPGKTPVFIQPGLCGGWPACQNILAARLVKFILPDRKPTISNNYYCPFCQQKLLARNLTPQPVNILPSLTKGLPSICQFCHTTRPDKKLQLQLPVNTPSYNPLWQNSLPVINLNMPMATQINPVLPNRCLSCQKVKNMLVSNFPLQQELTKSLLPLDIAALQKQGKVCEHLISQRTLIELSVILSRLLSQGATKGCPFCQNLLLMNQKSNKNLPNQTVNKFFAESNPFQGKECSYCQNTMSIRILPIHHQLNEFPAQTDPANLQRSCPYCKKYTSNQLPIIGSIKVYGI